MLYENNNHNFILVTIPGISLTFVNTAIFSYSYVWFAALTKVVVLSMQVFPGPSFQMVIGFWVSKTLINAVELEVFTELSGNKVVISNCRGIWKEDQIYSTCKSLAYFKYYIVTYNIMSDNIKFGLAIPQGWRGGDPIC